MISARTQLCMVVGDPVGHSLSPLLHNAGYAALGIDDQFVYVGCRVSPADIPAFVASVRALGVRGISCTTPHKETVMPLLDAIDPGAAIIGAVNTIVREGERLVGYNTDWIGAVRPLASRTELTGKKVAVIGAGGAAKATIYGFTQAGAHVIIYNRTLSKARLLAKQFGCQAAPLTDRAGLSAADIIYNATTVGMEPNENKSPLPTGCLHPGQIVFDAVYTPHHTRLLREAAACGAEAVYGVEMLLHQAAAQFELYTGRQAPLTAMRKALLAELRKRGDDDA